MIWKKEMILLEKKVQIRTKRIEADALNGK